MHPFSQTLGNFGNTDLSDVLSERSKTPVEPEKHVIKGGDCRKCCEKLEKLIDKVARTSRTA